MAEVASAYVSLLPSARGFGSATESAIGPQMSSVGKTAGKLIAVGIAGVLASAKGLFEVGQVFDDLSDTIVVTTGASGRALEGLEHIAFRIGRNTPSAFSDIGIAVAGLNQRLGLTGKPLKQVATQILNLSRLTGTDLQSNITSVTRLFGDWSIKTSDQAATLDKLFRASQETGIGVDQLSQFMVQFGSPLRQLGLDFDFTAAMFARFEKEGVNIQTAMPGLRMALKNFAQDGREPAKALTETFEAIKNASSAAKANTLAFEIFGTRAGPDMAAAIREGRFELGDLVKSLQNSRGAISEADKGTRDFAETWQIFKNRVLLKLRPIAEAFFAAFTDFAAAALPKIITGLEAVGGVLKPVFGFIADNKLIFGVVAGGIAAITVAMAALNLVLAVNPFILAAIGLAALAAGLVTAYKNSATFRDIVNSVAAFLAETFKPTLDQLVTTFRNDILPAIRQVIAKFREWWPTIQPVVEFIAKLEAKLIGLQLTILGKVLPPLIRLAGFLITRTVEAFSIVSDSIATNVAALRNLAEKVADVIGWFADLIGKVKDVGAKFKSAAERVPGLGTAIEGVTTAIKSMVTWIGKAVEGLLRLLGLQGDVAFKGQVAPGSGPGGTMAEPRSLAPSAPFEPAGRALMESLAAGITSAAKVVTDAAGGVLARLAAMVPGSPVKDGPLKSFNDGATGRSLMEMFAQGIQDGGPKVVATMVDQLTKLHDAAKSKLDDLKAEFASLRDSIATAFTPDLFQAATLGDFFAQGNAAFGQAVELRKAFKKLKKWGLDPQFLAQLFASGNAGLILDMADGTRSEANSAAALFQDIGNLTERLGRDVAKDAIGPRIDQTNKRLDRIEKVLDGLPHRIGKEMNGVASDGQRRRASAA